MIYLALNLVKNTLYLKLKVKVLSLDMDITVLVWVMGLETYL